MSKFVKKEQSKEISENPHSTFYEYGISFNKLAVGISEINGRYPTEGFDVDTVVEQVWYVESGSGTIGLESEEIGVSAGDMILISPNEKFYIDGNNLKLVVSSTPPWTTEQHKHLQ